MAYCLSGNFSQPSKIHLFSGLVKNKGIKMEEKQNFIHLSEKNALHYEIHMLIPVKWPNKGHTPIANFSSSLRISSTAIYCMFLCQELCTNA